QVGGGAAVVGAAEPLVGRPELESGRLWCGLDRVQGGEQGGGVNPVAHRAGEPGRGCVGSGHGGGSPSMGRGGGAYSPGQVAASKRSPGIGRSASAAAAQSISTLSRFCSSMNVGVPGKAASWQVISK